MSAKPVHKQTYNHRGPNRNPRTGEPLVPWEEVQVTDPKLAPLASYFVRVEVTNEVAPRKQLFLVRAPAGMAHTDELAELGRLTARLLGFVPTGWAIHD